MYAIWVGTLIDIHKPLILVCEKGKEEESILRLARVGYENVIGYLDGGFEAWQKSGKPVSTILTVDAPEFAAHLKDEKEKVLDVRNMKEVEEGHIKDAIVIPLADLGDNLESIPKNENVYIHCAGGYRSMIASSILKMKGFNNITMVNGGWNKIKHTAVEIEKGIPVNVGTPQL